MKNINPDIVLKSMLEELPLRLDFFDILKSYTECKNNGRKNKSSILTISNETENLQQVDLSEDTKKMLKDVIDNKIETSTDLKDVFNYIDNHQTGKEIKNKKTFIANSLKFKNNLSTRVKENLRLDLIRNKFISTNSSRVHFNEIFSGHEINPENRIWWKGGLPPLKHFIESIFPLLEIGDKKWKMHVAVKCFVNGTGNEFIPRSIGTSKIKDIPKEKLIRLNDCIEIIMLAQ
jgi:hypothetical protein